MRNFFKRKQSGKTVAFLVIVFLLAGCGRKGDPIPPEAADIVPPGWIHQENGKSL